MRLLRRLSITTRITLTSVLIAIAVAIAAVVSLRIGVEHLLTGTTETLLAQDTSSVTAQLHVQPSQRPGVARNGQYVSIVNPSGELVLSTFPRALRQQFTELRDLSAEAGTTDQVVIEPVAAGGTHYLVRIEPVSTSSGRWRVAAARNLDTNALTLSRLTRAMTGVAALMVAGFGLASWLLARAALRPVARMRAEAASIAGGDSAELLPGSDAHDELADLAGTLNTLIVRLRAAAERERRMVSDASHELRTPLAVLQGRLEVAELDAGDPEALLGDIRASRQTVQRLTTLSNNLLELSRIEAGRGEGGAGWDELAEEVAVAADEMRLAHPMPSLLIDFELTPAANGGRGRAPLSRSDFARILGNLVSNAVDAVQRSGRPGSVTIALAQRRDEAVLTVTDTGDGMPPEFLPVATQRFTRPEASRTGSGSGLGLSIVEALTTSAGGSVTLANLADGFAATVRLPLRPPG